MDILHILNLAAMVAALTIAIVGHEIMHGYIAYRYKDDTAKEAGRLSINPLKHIDPVGTVIVPALLYISNAGFLFGWAKPVPVDMYKVISNGGYNGAIAVSLAGVAYNFFLAALGAVATSALWEPSTLFEAFLLMFFAQTVLINTVLGVFNLWPIPPLDGANAMLYFSKKIGFRGFERLYESIYPYGMIILIVIIATPLSKIFFAPVYFIIELLSRLSGIDQFYIINIIERI